MMITIKEVPKVMREQWQLTLSPLQVTFEEQTLAGIPVHIVTGLDFDCWFVADRLLADYEHHQLELLVFMKLLENYPKGNTTLIELKSIPIESEQANV
jgi:hypothetical protein